MLSKIAARMNISALGPSPWTLPVISHHFAVMRCTQTATGNSNDDAHLLVMLADQACVEGRPDQALSLLDAAYSAFDRRVVEKW